MNDSFFDTNTLIYLISSDLEKAARAELLLRSGGHISVQVLNEIVNVSRRKLKLTWDELGNFLNLVRARLQVHDVSVEVHETSLAVAQRYGLATYDAVIVASALLCGCAVLWSEDMHHGLVIDGRLRIRNPFAGG